LNNKIYFRADGNAQIGLGHLTRCVALAQMLKSTFEIIFVCKEITKEFILELDKLEVKLILISNETDFFEFLNSKDIIVLDHYGLDTAYQRTIKELGCKLVCIDDLHEQFFHADLIINHAPNVKASSYQTSTYTQFALGLDYVLLRPIFLQRALTKRIEPHINIAFVCFGGSDSKNLTKVVVELLISDERFKIINIVIGSAYEHVDELIDRIKADQRFKLYHGIDQKEMANLISDSSIAIVPASGILQEVLALGCRAVSGIYVENQRQIYENYKLMNAFEDAGTFIAEEIKTAIDNAYKNNTNTGKPPLIDGKSGERLLNKFKQLINQDNLTLRLAIADDVDLTYKWAKDKTIRKYSFATHEITFDEHAKWFLSKVNSEDNYYFIALLDGDNIGSIRFDLKDGGAIISYLLDPLYHQKGLGGVLLKKGLEFLISMNNANVNFVKGYVMAENISSIKTFVALGYEMEKEGEYLRFIKKIK
jgi:UDP-2,4-diacetamido-2,4,6-trideoxy-beta-L-altropyranose hydrolase